MKNKKLHDIMKHSNGVTKSIVEQYNMINAKEIAKVNQVTDLLLAIKSNSKLLNIVYDAIDKTKTYINENHIDDSHRFEVNDFIESKRIAAYNSKKRLYNYEGRTIYLVNSTNIKVQKSDKTEELGYKLIPLKYVEDIKSWTIKGKTLYIEHSYIDRHYDIAKHIESIYEI